VKAESEKLKAKSEKLKAKSERQNQLLGFLRFPCYLCEII